MLTRRIATPHIFFAWLAAAVFAVAVLAPAQAQDGLDLVESEIDEYTIGLDDKLKIIVWNEPDLSLTVTVRPDGRITMPLINDVDAAGRTTNQLRDEISSRLANLVRDPAVSVIVEEINSFKVYVLGEVNTQGVLTLTQPTRLLQAIASSGGLTQYSKREVTVVRQFEDSEQRMDIDLKKLLSGAPTRDNVFLAPGDLLLVR